VHWDTLITRVNKVGLAPPDATTNRADRGDHDLNPDMKPPDQLIPAAVLIPLINRRDGVMVMLTKRSEAVPDHPGQISFPGGHIDASDASPRAAALREADEEVGLPSNSVEVVGELDIYITRTGFHITPVVGLVRPPFDIRPNPSEVAEVFELPFELAVDPANYERRSRVFEGRLRNFYVLTFEDRVVWGATAGMLVNLAQVLHGQ
jgi:8-oxo-dGTP pyrophosphatase MutT (NUDIX family)